MRQLISDVLTRVANWLDGSGWEYDEFDHGWREGAKDARRRAPDEIDRMHLALSEILYSDNIDWIKARALIALPDKQV